MSHLLTTNPPISSPQDHIAAITLESIARYPRNAATAEPEVFNQMDVKMFSLPISSREIPELKTYALL